MIHHGDALEVMRTMPDASVDAICTDPPYGLEFMGKRWDAFKSPGHGARVSKERAAELTPRGKGHSTSKGPFLAAGVDQYIAGTPYQQWCEAWGREALRVMVPGGYLLAFGGTRTHHRLVCGLEDAGWIIRDELTWVYASGFPKGKANLKPAHEPIVLARKPGPLRALAIDECRIPSGDEEIWTHHGTPGGMPTADNSPYRPGDAAKGVTAGRWPSNLLLSDPELFDEPNPYVVGSGAVTTNQENRTDPSSKMGRNFGSDEPKAGGGRQEYLGDSGGYSRFFIVPKADRADREPVGGGLPGAPRPAGAPAGTSLNRTRVNGHPTVKPTDLMRHLVRLVTPAGGTVLDPFLGSGSTAIACELEGFAWIGIEKEAEYVQIAEARLNGVQKGMGLSA